MERPLGILFALLALVIATRVGGFFAFPPSGISTFWPPNAILLASLLLLDEKDRKTCLLLAFPAFLLAEIWIGFDFSDSLVFAAVNCLAVLVALRLSSMQGMEIAGLPDLRCLKALFLAVFSASVVGATLGAGWVAITGGPFASTALKWGLADFVGYIVFVPFLLTARNWLEWWSKAAPLDISEATATAFIVAASSVLVYGPSLPQHYHGAQFLPIPALLWMALRFGPKGAATGSLLVAMIALSYAINGFGPFSDLSPEDNAMSLQFFITSVVLASLLVSVLLNERDQALHLLSERDQLEKEARYRALVDLATDGIMILDADKGSFIEANPRAARLFGYAAQDLIRSVGPSDLSPEFQPDGRRSDEASRAYIKDALEGNFPTFEWVHKDSDGREFMCRVSLARFPDRERNLIRASVLDLSEEKELERRRHDLEAQLAQSQKLESIGQLTGGVAHDFNNLLNVILGNLELLRDDVREAEKIEMIDAAIHATQRGADLTKNMLAFARRANLKPAELDLSEVARKMDNWIARTIPASIRVEKSLEPNLWKIEADPSTTESALLNLLINARDAMPEGGVITIETANVVLDAPLGSGPGDDLPAGQYVLLALSDNGVGVSPDNLARVFEPFFTTKGPAAGSGLGLSMVHGFMRQTGGGARIYSNPGTGTTVKLYFPVSPSAMRRKPDPAVEADEREVDSARILLAEDQKAVADLLIRILRIEGHEVVAASSGDQALEIFRNDQSFDLLITDIVMPGRLQGPALARSIRQIAPDLPAVFMSGYAREATVHGNGLKETDIRLMKPVSRSDLVAAVKSALEP